MEKYIKQLKQEFERIKNLGWIESKRQGTTGVGYTFESLLGKEEENFELPDYQDIEIKTHLTFGRGKMKLFTATPDGDYLFAIQSIVAKYGYPDKDLPNYKVFKGTVNSQKFTPIGTHYLFKIVVNRKEEKLQLLVVNQQLEKESEEVSWSFQMIEEKLTRKLQTLAVVSAYQKEKSGKVFYQYHNIEFFSLKSFDVFIELIEKGVVQINFTIGIFKKGERIGQLHDHGTEFIIHEKDIKKLYSTIS